MIKRILVLRILTICLVMNIAAGAIAVVVIDDSQERQGVELMPWAPMRQDLKLFQQESNAANGKLAGARPKANLPQLTCGLLYENMKVLLESMRIKVKASKETRAQERAVLDYCNEMKPKLDNLGLLVKNFQVAIRQGDTPSAQGLLYDMEETAKELHELIVK